MKNGCFLFEGLASLDHDCQTQEEVEVHMQRARPGHSPDQLHDPALLLLYHTDPLQPARVRTIMLVHVPPY